MNYDKMILMGKQILPKRIYKSCSRSMKDSESSDLMIGGTGGSTYGSTVDVTNMVHLDSQPTSPTKSLSTVATNYTPKSQSNKTRQLIDRLDIPKKIIVSFLILQS